MKNVKKTLEEKLQKTEEQFNELDRKRQSNNTVIQNLQTENGNILQDLLRLQGEYRSITELMGDFQDEPKDEKA